MRAEAERLVCEAVRRTLWSIQGQQGTPEGKGFSGEQDGSEVQGFPEGVESREGQGLPEGTGSPEGQDDPRQRANSLAITAAWL